MSTRTTPRTTPHTNTRTSPFRLMSATPRRRAFTLIELLIVIGIIGILVAIAAVLGKKVVGGSNASAAADILRVLDAVLTEFESATNAPTPASLEWPDASKVPFRYPIIDARVDGTNNYDRVKDPPVNSIVRFTALVSTATSAQSVLKQINSKYVRQVPVHVNAKDPVGLEVTDPWGNLVRAVHPSFDGGYGDFGVGGSVMPRQEKFRTVIEKTPSGTGPVNYRRSFRPYRELPEPPATYSGDADEGMCANKRMYFYSAGIDGDPGTRADNVYMVRPAFPQETAKY